MWDDSTRLIVDVGGCERKMWNLAGAKSFHFFRDFATHRVTHFDVITFSLSCWGGPCALCTYGCKTLLSYVRVESFFFIKSIHATKICQFGMIYFKYKLSLSIMIPYKIHIYSWTMVSLYLSLYFFVQNEFEHQVLFVYLAYLLRTFAITGVNFDLEFRRTAGCVKCGTCIQKCCSGYVSVQLYN